MHEIDLDKAQREETRWRILRALDAGSPSAVAETVLYRALADIDLPLTPHGLRRELDYLRDCGLVTLECEETPTWMASMTAQGVNVVEYATPAPAGISRPKKWW